MPKFRGGNQTAVALIVSRSLWVLMEHLAAVTVYVCEGRTMGFVYKMPRFSGGKVMRFSLRLSWTLGRNGRWGPMVKFYGSVNQCAGPVVCSVVMSVRAGRWMVLSRQCQCWIWVLWEGLVDVLGLPIAESATKLTVTSECSPLSSLNYLSYLFCEATLRERSTVLNWC